MLTDFKECMSTNNHGGVLADNDQEEPIVQTVALARLRGIGGEAPLPTDERDKCDVTTQVIRFVKNYIRITANIANPDGQFQVGTIMTKVIKLGNMKYEK